MNEYIKINQVKTLFAVNDENGKFKSWRQGDVHEVNDVHRVDTYIALYYSKKYKCDDVYINSQQISLDEAIEHYFTDGAKVDDKFWKTAPYRTNGHVFEEIKMAVKYFLNKNENRL